MHIVVTWGNEVAPQPQEGKEMEGKGDHLQPFAHLRHDNKILFDMMWSLQFVSSLGFCRDAGKFSQ